MHSHRIRLIKCRAFTSLDLSMVPLSIPTLLFRSISGKLFRVCGSYHFLSTIWQAQFTRMFKCHNLDVLRRYKWNVPIWWDCCYKEKHTSSLICLQWYATNEMNEIDEALSFSLFSSLPFFFFVHVIKFSCRLIACNSISLHLLLLHHRMLVLIIVLVAFRRKRGWMQIECDKYSNIPAFRYSEGKQEFSLSFRAAISVKSP